jgi:DNA adenine methylase
MDAVSLIVREDTPTTLFYLDPPYYPGSRTTPDVYAHEMRADEHAELIAAIRRCKGKVMLSGYHNDLYDRQLKSWTVHEFDLPNHAAGGGTKRRMTEVLWCNY